MGEAKRKKAAGYIPRVMANLRATPGLTHIFVQHDSWCSHFSGGHCDCFPEVTMREDRSDTVRTVGPDGAVTATARRN